MIYKVNIPGFEGQNIEVKTGFWPVTKLLVNGHPAPKGSKRGEMLLQSNDGTQVVAKWKPRLLGLDIPQLVVDDKVISLAEPLKWYQLIWSGLPVVLLFGGGLLGVIPGIMGFAINVRVFRTEMNEILKYVVSGAVSILAFVVYFVAALLFVALTGGM